MQHLQEGNDDASMATTPDRVHSGRSTLSASDGIDRPVSFWEFLSHMFNGNETARSMRYSSFVIIAALVAGYLGILSSETITSIVTASMGYIFGKARSETHVIEPKDRRKEV